MKTKSPTRIGIAVVEWNGRFLVGERADGQPLAGYAEFPGGKCRSDEPSQDCARRECLEETGIKVEPTELLRNGFHKYDHGSVDLDFWLCQVVDETDIGELQNGFHWVATEELEKLRFPEANDVTLEMLRQRFLFDG